MSEFELYVYLLTVGLAATATALRTYRNSKLTLVILGSALALAACGVMAWMLPARPVVADLLPEQNLHDENTVSDFASSDACRSCHPGPHASWYRTFHRTMTQEASPESVLAPFDGALLQSRGRSYRPLRINGEFWVEMADPDWETEARWKGIDLASVTDPPRVLRRIVMTTGSHHYQGYWVRSTRGVKLHQLPFVYHLDESRWIPTEDAFLRPPDAGRRFAVWNTNCIQCHAVAGQPRLDEATQVLSSRVAELSIACEACHGPGGEHVRKHQNPLTRYAQRLSDEPDSTIVNPASCDHEKSSEVCGQCHNAFEPTDEADWWKVGYRYRAGDDLEKSYRPYAFSPDLKDLTAFHSVGFWKDGTQRVGGREYLGMIESGCYKRGEMSCLSCHSMHDSDPNDQLAKQLESDGACLQCHDSHRTDLESHTHHAANSEGSRCYNCHMPHTSYALFTSIRSHRIDIPSAESSAQTGRPNACNLCHTDRTLQWTSDHLQSWYDMPPASSLDEEQRGVSAALLWALKGDAVQRVIIADQLGWDAAREVSGDNWQALPLAQLLEDPYAVVRMVAWKSLRKFPPYAEIPYDFIGTPEERAAVRKQVLEIWRAEQKPPAEDLRHLLIDSTGQLDKERWNKLLSERDDTPMELPE